MTAFGRSLIFLIASCRSEYLVLILGSERNRKMINYLNYSLKILFVILFFYPSVKAEASSPF